MHTVLIVEDDDCFQYLCKVVFERSGLPYRLLYASDGMEAFEVIETHEGSIDLILLDINMPRMNGHEFLEEYARRNPGEIPMIAMLTTSDQKGDREIALQYSFVRDYIVKPLTEDHVRRFDQHFESLGIAKHNEAASI